MQKFRQLAVLGLAILMLAAGEIGLSAGAQSSAPADSKNAAEEKTAGIVSEKTAESVRAAGLDTKAADKAAGDGRAAAIDATSTSEKPAATLKYEQRIKEFREFMKDARDHMIDYHIARTAAETDVARKAFLAAVDRGRSQYGQMISAALEEYAAAPTKDAKLADFLFGVLSRGCAQDRFEGLLEIGLALDKAGYKREKLDLYIGMAAVATDQYDTAKPFLERVFSQPIDPEKNKDALQLFEQQFGYLQSLENLKSMWQEELTSRAADSAGEPLPRVKFLTTKGAIELELFENQAPETVGNFVKLIEDGFYNGLSFHRVLEHFMAQTGCPNGDGSGDPGYTIVGELNSPGARKYFRGTVGMALANGPNTGGSQFFICFLPQPQLNGGYVAFGRVVSGIDVLSDIVRVDKSSTEKEQKEATGSPDEIISAEIISKRNHPYEPNIASRTEAGN